MSIKDFMAAYKRVWEGQDSEGFAALFTPEGEYWNTPFQCQNSFDLRKTYWDRIKLQEDISLRYEVLAQDTSSGIAHWHVEYQVASEELFAIWAKSTGTGMPGRKPGDPLPRLILDGMLIGSFDAQGRATNIRIFWHSMADPG